MRFQGSHFRSAILLIAGTVLMTTLCTAQITPRGSSGTSGPGSNRGSHSIRGKIFLPNGTAPDIRIHVILEVSTGGVFSETFSDSVGNFEFRSLPTNNYRVVIASDGMNYDSAQEPIEISGSVSRTFTVQIYLREKKRDRELTSNKKMISAGDVAQDVPKPAKKSYENGLKKLDAGKLEDAVSNFQEALKIFPDYVMAHDKLGQCYVNQNKFAEAQSEFELALKINPKFPLTLVYLGMLKVRQKQYSEAIELLESANRMDESFAMSHLHLGISFMEKPAQEAGDFEKAEKAFLTALSLGGKNLAQVHKYLFNLYLRRKYYDKAAAELEAYLNDVPNASDAQQIRDMVTNVKKAASEPPNK